jgi:hypothetical protein
MFVQPARQRARRDLVREVGLAAAKDARRDVLLVEPRREQARVLVADAVGRQLRVETLLRLVAEHDDAHLGSEQPRRLARQKLADAADLRARPHHQRDVVEAAQALDVAAKMAGRLVEDAREPRRLVLALRLDGLEGATEQEAAR